MLLANGVEVGLWTPMSNTQKELAYIITRMTMMANKPARFTAGYIHMDRETYKTVLMTLRKSKYLFKVPEFRIQRCSGEILLEYNDLRILNIAKYLKK